MHNTIDVLLVVVIAAAAIGFNYYYQCSRSRSILEEWAAQNGYEMIKSELRYLRKGPFFWTSSRGQVVYYVGVRDGQGRDRYGWVRCGGWWLGLASNKAVVRWDERDGDTG
jgi:hypothetical protein